MIEQLSDSGFTSGGVGDAYVTSNVKQQPAIVKKHALRDLPNENNVTVPKLGGDSTLPKEMIHVKYPDKVSGIKRPSSEVNSPPSQPSGSVNANGSLVYVRRKTEAEVGKISSFGTTGNNNDLQLSVNNLVTNEKVVPNMTLNSSQIDSDNMRPSSEKSKNSPTLPTYLSSETPLADSTKSGANVSSSENTSMLPSVGKLGITTLSTEIKSVPANSVGISGDTMSNTQNKSAHPHHIMSGNSTVSSENKYPLHPLGKLGNTMSSTETKTPVYDPQGNSDVITVSVGRRSQLPRPVVNPAAYDSSVENKSLIPSQGKSGNIMPSAENNHIPPSVTSKVDLSKEPNRKHLQHWHAQPRISLRDLDQSGHEEFLQMLRSLSSVELSRLAVELETRSIQLSLEEAREMARVEMLNVMGKAAKSLKSPTALPEK